MKVLELIHALTNNIDLNANVEFKDCMNDNDFNFKITSVGYDEEKKLVILNNVYDITPLRKRWHSVDDILPPYGMSVIAHLKGGGRCMTHRTDKDYSKDSHDFLHVSIADDVDYWIDIPEF